MIKIVHTPKDGVHRSILCGRVRISASKSSAGSLNLYTAEEIEAVSAGDVITVSEDTASPTGMPEILFTGRVRESREMADGSTFVVAADALLDLLKNRGVYVWQNTTASQMLRRVLTEREIAAGVIEETSHRIVSKVTDGASLFDMMSAVLREEYEYTGEVYALSGFDGGISLTSSSGMTIPLEITEETAERILLTKTAEIPGVVNRVIITDNLPKLGRREVYTLSDPGSIARFGVSEKYVSAGEDRNYEARARAVLKTYAAPREIYTVTRAVGDNRVRLNSRLYITRRGVRRLVRVAECEHVWAAAQHADCTHLMNLTCFAV